MQDEHQTTPGQLVSMRSSDSLQSPTMSLIAARALFTLHHQVISQDQHQPRGIRATFGRTGGTPTPSKLHVEGGR